MSNTDVASVAAILEFGVDFSVCMIVLSKASGRRKTPGTPSEQVL
jgi:hypothetical protein